MSQPPAPATTFLEGVHCVLTIERPGPGVVLVTFSGTDVGEFGDRPFRDLEQDLDGARPIELFIDAHAGKSASIDVSNEWARWLREHRAALRRIHMLTATRFIQLSADLVRRYAGLEDRMRLYTSPVAFAEALLTSGTIGARRGNA
jgi:hypothetical protein